MIKLSTLLKALRFRHVFRDIQLVVCDVDGVLTNGRLIYGNASIQRVFNVYDGMAISLLISHGIQVAFISGSTGDSISSRARHLQVEHCYTSIADKNSCLALLQNKLNIKPENTLFVGDDLNDMPVRPIVRAFIAPSNACPLVRRIADITTFAEGGSGVIREIVDMISFSSRPLRHSLRNGAKRTNG